MDSFTKNSLAGVANSLAHHNNFEYDYVFEFLKEQNKTNADIIGYYMALEDNFFASGTGWTPTEDYIPTEKDWYKSAIDNDGIITSSPYIDSYTGNMVITISMPLKIDDVAIGVVASDVYIDKLIEVIGQVDLGIDSYAFLTDANGDIIAHLNEEYKPTAEKGFVNIGNILEGKLSAIMSDKSLSLDDKVIKDYDGVERIFLFNNIEESGWKVGMAVSAEESLRVLNNVIRSSIILTIVILVAAVIVSIILANSISKPILNSGKFCKEYR